METDARPGRADPKDELGFYVAGSDRELVRQITELFGKKGYVGVADGYGRMRYLVDGRTGPATAASRVLGTADEAVRRKMEKDERLLPYESAAITAVLDESRIDPALKGYRFVRYMLSLTFRDETLLRPITKTLHPAVAEHFRVKPEHVERDVRYAIRHSGFKPAGVTSGAALCLLHDRTVVRAEAMHQRDQELRRERTGSGRPENGTEPLAGLRSPGRENEGPTSSWG
jgi:hypothetical protein